MNTRGPIIILALLANLWGVASNGQDSPSSPVTSTVVTPPAKENFHVYLLMGQSNMAGRGALGLVEQADDARILALNTNDQWVVARDPLHQKDGRIEPGVGPGMSFAREMLKANTNIVIGLVPCAVGGSPLKRWVKGGDLYEQALSRAKLAAQAGVISGVLWHQGETDADKQSLADTYEERLSQMIKDLRRDLGQPNLPVVVGQLGEFLSAGKHPYVETVRAAIKNVPVKLEHVGYADSAGLVDKGDKLHFNTDSQRKFGIRYAVAMQQLNH